jgi:hypothetical protein
MRFMVLSLVVALTGSSAYGTEQTPTLEKGHAMKMSHAHVGVKDLPGALRWLDLVWGARPGFQNERMAAVSFGTFTIFMDASSTDTPLTLGFDSKDCDADFDTVISRGGVALEAPADRPWGVRAAYIQGPGALKFEIEQVLPRK